LDPKEVHDFEKKKWWYCSKCGHWLTRHDMNTHKEFLGLTDWQTNDLRPQRRPPSSLPITLSHSLM
jgi:hypothetical protein